MKRIPSPSPFLPVLVALALLAARGAAAQEEDGGRRSLHWSEVTVSARLDEEGRLHVRERQAMVFTGAWNGGERVFDLRTGQQLRLNGIIRVDSSGVPVPLTPGDLDAVDEFDRVDDGRVRWRSRASSDPPFRDREIVYELDYTIWPVLVPTGVGTYELSHDFVFPDRDGTIERFQVDLTLDPAWSWPGGSRIRETATDLPAGRGWVIDIPVRYVGTGAPEAVPAATPGWARPVVVIAGLLVPVFVLLGLRRRDRELDAVAPITPAAKIDDVWLRTNVFCHPPEVVGASWDRSVGEAEVAALLARLVTEGKLSSRVETGTGREPVLHLTREAPLDSFPEHERELLGALFFDGGRHTDTASIRKHYQTKGFDPAAKIRGALTARLDSLPGGGRVRRRWGRAALLTLAGAALVVASPGQPGRGPIVVFGLVAGALVALMAITFSLLLARRVTRRAIPAVGIVLPLVTGAILLALLAAGAFEGGNRLVFYHPSAPLLLSFAFLLAGIGTTAHALTQPTEQPERLSFRRRLVSARRFFESELERAAPRLEDRWFPYLLAFGLGSHVDRWFRAWGRHEAAGPAMLATGGPSGRSGGTSSSGGWTGGGPQFGGGSWGGGGAGGAWSVAAAGMAAGVSPPSSGGGGGSAASGGGGGGGW